MEAVVPFHEDMSLCQTNRKNDIARLSNQKKKKKKKIKQKAKNNINDFHLGISSNSWGAVCLPFVHHIWHTQKSASQDLLSSKFLVGIEDCSCKTVHPHPHHLSQKTSTRTTKTAIVNPKNEDWETFRKKTLTETMV
jgi:hypothetical protein